MTTLNTLEDVLSYKPFLTEVVKYMTELKDDYISRGQDESGIASWTEICKDCNFVAALDASNLVVTGNVPLNPSVQIILNLTHPDEGVISVGTILSHQLDVASKPGTKDNKYLFDILHVRVVRILFYTLWWKRKNTSWTEKIKAFDFTLRYCEAMVSQIHSLGFATEDNSPCYEHILDDIISAHAPLLELEKRWTNLNSVDLITSGINIRKQMSRQLLGTMLDLKKGSIVSVGEKIIEAERLGVLNYTYVYEGGIVLEEPMYNPCVLVQDLDGHKISNKSHTIYKRHQLAQKLQKI